MLLAQVQSRDQRSIALLALDPKTGASRVVMVEASETWINLHDVLYPLPGGK